MTVKTESPMVAGQSWPAILLSAFGAAMQTLTRLPTPQTHAPTPRTMSWSAVFYPLVGLLLAVAGIGMNRLAAEVFPPSVTALLVLTLWMLLTGALHEDGLADVFDAFASQRSRDDVLRVMKDSSIGTYGALALAVSLLLRWQALVLLPATQMAAVLVASQVLPRGGIVFLAYAAGPASKGSGGTLAACLQKRHVALGVVLAAVIVLPFAGWRAMMAMAVVCAAIVAFSSRYFSKRIGGVTGDCLGAANQIQEIAVFLTLFTLQGITN